MLLYKELNDLKQRLLDLWAAVDKRIIYYFVNVHFDRFIQCTDVTVPDDSSL